MVKTIGKIILSGVVGTIFMTLYIRKKSKDEHQQFLQPVLLNKLIDNAKNLPDIKNKKNNPTGWVLHYGAGVSFVTAYYLLVKNVLLKPTITKILLTGTISGLIGIVIWKTLFKENHRPPQNNRFDYYRELLLAHIVFSLFAILSYKSLEEIDKKSVNFISDEKTNL